MKNETLELRKRMLAKLENRSMARQLLTFLTLPEKYARMQNKIEQDKLAEAKKLLEVV